VVFHIDAITGADSTGHSKDDAIFEGHDLIQGPLVEGYLLNAETKVVVLLDEFLQVHHYLLSSMARFNSRIWHRSISTRTTPKHKLRLPVSHTVYLSLCGPTSKAANESWATKSAYWRPGIDPLLIQLGL